MKTDARNVLVPVGAKGKTPNGPVGSSLLALVLLLGLVLPVALTYSFATQSELLVVAFFILAIFSALVFYNPFFGVNFLIFLFYIRPEENIKELSGMRLVFSASLLSFFVIFIKKFVSYSGFNRNPALVLMSLFSATTILSSVQRGLFSMALSEMLILLVVVWLIIDQVDSIRRFEVISLNVVFCTFYVSAFSIYSYYSGKFLQHGDVQRALGTGILSDPNDLAAVILPGLAMAVVNMRQYKKWSWLFLVVALVCGYALILTQSRGGLVGFVAAAVTYFWIFNKSRTLGLLFALVMGGGAVAFAPGRMSNLDQSEESANDRLEYWINGIQSFMHRPVLGIGFRGFEDMNDGHTAHNSYVLCFTEIGFIGYIFWIGIIYLAYKVLVKLYKNIDVKYAGFLIGLNGLLVSCFFISRTYNVLLISLIAIGASMYRVLREKNFIDKFTAGEMVKVAWFGVVSIAFIYAFARIALMV